ncbi:MAG: hypothetical protein NVSMB51_08130 [Solirubrobacteraceae bacterium]
MSLTGAWYFTCMEGLVLAHMGHILVDGPLFLGPVVVLMAALGLHTAHARRSDSAPSSEREPGGPR